ncbi:MAG TPA: adenylate/guanylate cyclase domain-containing protein [Candidatus Binatia bacterium]|nr:adenylate/guanylate cyclase domain-containing protein [Candidatus Binatia bacterium]
MPTDALGPEALATLAAAGLYDPTAPQAAQRRALLEWLAGRGVTAAEMIAAVRRGGSLTGLAGDLALRPGGDRLTLAEVAARAGLSPQRVEHMRLAAALPAVGPDEPAFSTDDVAIFTAFARGAALFGEAALRDFMHIVGAALGRVAEAAVSLFVVNIEGPIHEAGGDELALAQANLRAIGALDLLLPAMRSLFRAHMETAIRRLRTGRAPGSVDLVQRTVGFVDLVGFTSLSRRQSARELAELLLRFEGLAHDIVVARDGRLVKLIGDEAMFVAIEPTAACDIALTLVDQVVQDRAVTPRGGLASGLVLSRGGDYYGPVVNQAARIAELAVPGEVLATAEVAAAAGARFGFQPAGKRLLKGFDEPVTLFAATRGESPS